MKLTIVADGIADSPDGVRYFFEGGVWRCDGEKAKRLRALLSYFRRSDWGEQNGFHLSGCHCNQYLIAACSESCRTMTEMVWAFGGFPKDFDPKYDERNEYRSSLETYG